MDGRESHAGGVTIAVWTAAERPDLWERGIPSAQVWPEYNLHGDVLNPLWNRLAEELAAFQFVLYDDEADAVLAEGHTGPFFWDGDEDSLPPGIDDALIAVLAPGRSPGVPNTLCALAAEVPRDGRQRGLAGELLAGMRSVGQRQGLRHFVAPVRPSWKERYPLAPIERYVTWRRPDGSLLDPWMRLHERLGARVSRPLSRSMKISGSVAEWETWTGLVFLESGEYVFPEGLATVTIDRERDVGTYFEPNVWMIHPDL